MKPFWDWWRRPFPSGLAVAVLTFVLLVATGPRLAIVWDEGYTLGREARIRLWLAALRDPERFAAAWVPPRSELVQQDRVGPPAPREINSVAKLLGPRALAWFWPFAREEPHGHPPFYAIVGLVGDVIAPFVDDVLVRARLGPMLAFSLAAGALHGFMLRRYGHWPAIAAAGAWVLQPRLFAHAHYATYDALLTSLWLGGVLAFAQAVGRGRPGDRPSWGWVIVFGILYGWAADTKLTGWFLPLPCAVWAVIFRDRRAGWALLVGGLIAAVVLYVFNPSFWPDPLGGAVRFWRSNLSRGRTIPIEVLFLGRVYRTPLDSLPWYNTLVWTGLVTPVGFLGLALLGAGCALKRFRIEPFGVLAVGHWAFLLLLRAMPHTPGHDGERQFLPAFGMLAIIAALGAAGLVARWRKAGVALVVLAIVEGAGSIAVMMPVPLSYYSPLVGGLPGATRLGMEPTYYWDALDANALDRLNRHTPDGRSVLFATNPTSWLYLRETGRLAVPLAPFDPEPPAWYVVQNRPGALRSHDRDLIQRFGDKHVIASKLGVPLVWAFPYEALREGPSP